MKYWNIENTIDRRGTQGRKRRGSGGKREIMNTKEYMEKIAGEPAEKDIRKTGLEGSR